MQYLCTCVVASQWLKIMAIQTSVGYLFVFFFLKMVTCICRRCFIFGIILRMYVQKPIHLHCAPSSKPFYGSLNAHTQYEKVYILCFIHGIVSWKFQFCRTASKFWKILHRVQSAIEILTNITTRCRASVGDSLCCHLWTIKCSITIRTARRKISIVGSTALWWFWNVSMISK